MRRSSTPASGSNQGAEVTYLPVDSDGLVSLDDVKAALDETSRLSQ
jgi:cysteine sulfinate desulfinase/cysteine desulfurase-like protein